MGNKTKGRPKGKPKKKSIKAKVTSTMGSKRRLSRMGKESKKGMRGSAANYMTRSQILKRLQITLKDFRRLCILKGIYPRDPKKQLKGKHQTYYHIKDVSYLAHEPLLAKFREFKAFMRKVRRSVGRGELGEARRRERQKPQYTLHHLVRERHRPRLVKNVVAIAHLNYFLHFVLTLKRRKKQTNKNTAACQALMREWQFYVARAGALTKAFVSIKGVYFQRRCKGQPVTWVVPLAVPRAACPGGLPGHAHLPRVPRGAGALRALQAVRGGGPAVPAAGGRRRRRPRRRSARRGRPGARRGGGGLQRRGRPPARRRRR
ncbi:unnamed protein product [Heterosigma akashiwo]